MTDTEIMEEFRSCYYTDISGCLSIKIGKVQQLMLRYPEHYFQFERDRMESGTTVKDLCNAVDNVKKIVVE